MDKRYVDLNEILLALPKSAAKIIEDWPAANVREVVYCKDCLHFNYDDIEGGWCDEWGKEVGSPNFYCADADIRKTGLKFLESF